MTALRGSSWTRAAGRPPAVRDRAPARGARRGARGRPRGARPRRAPARGSPVEVAIAAGTAAAARRDARRRGAAGRPGAAASGSGCSSRRSSARSSSSPSRAARPAPRTCGFAPESYPAGSRARLPGGGASIRRARRRWPSTSTPAASTACAPAASRCPPGCSGRSGLREPIGAGHPLRIAEAVARLGGRPVARATSSYEEAVLALLAPAGAHHRAPRGSGPGPRVARRILQRLDGMGKWGGYHTEFAHLPRGFAGNERALAQEVGEALLDAGLLAEKPSVGQRHVFLNPRRAADIRALIETGRRPTGYATAARVKGSLHVDLPAGSQRGHHQAPYGRHAHRARGSSGPSARTAWRAARALLRWGPTPAAGYAANAARYPGRHGDHRRARDAELPGGPGAHQRARARAPRGRHRRGRQRGDHVPQPPRLHRRLRRVLEARRQRAVPQHRVLRPAAHRRGQARGAQGADLRPRVRRPDQGRRQAAQALHRLARPGGRQGRGPAARGPDRAAATRPTSAAVGAAARRSSSPRARRARRRARRARSPSRSTRRPRCWR